MATSEQIRNRIVELIKQNEFETDDLLQVFAQLAHENIIRNSDIVEIASYLLNDILQAKTRMAYSREINPRTGKKRSYNAHKFAKGQRFYLSGIEFIVDNK